MLIDQVKKDVRNFIFNNPGDWTATQIYDKMKQTYGENIIREALNALDKEKVINVIKSRSNLHLYNNDDVPWRNVKKANLVRSISRINKILEELEEIKKEIYEEINKQNT